MSKKVGRPEEVRKYQSSQGQGLPKEEAYGPWILVARKKKQSRKIQKELDQLPLLELVEYGPKKLMDIGPSNMALVRVNMGLGNSVGKQKQKALVFSFSSGFEVDCTTNLSLLNNTKDVLLNVKGIGTG